MSEYTKDQLEKQQDPLLQKTAGMVTDIYAGIGRETIDTKEVINETNPNLKALLDWAKDMNQENIDNAVSIEKNESGLTLKYPFENQPDYSVNYPVSDPVYRAIFWPEIKAEEENRKASAITTLKTGRQIEALRAQEEAKALRDGVKPIETSVINGLLQQRIEANKNLQEQDVSKIKDSLIKDLRLNRGLLTNKESEKPEDKIKNLKEETARRVAAYTTINADGWYTLDYQKMQSDKKGHAHERYVGLGDILLDEDIRTISVKKDDKEAFTAYRGFTSEGRPCFKTEAGRYVSTFTGDQFKIIEDEANHETNLKNAKDVEQYMARIEETKKQTAPYKEELEKNGLRSRNSARYDYQNVEIGGESEIIKAQPLAEETIIARLNAKREQADGAEIVAYGKSCTREYGIPWVIFKELVDVESTWDATAYYKGKKKSDAAGLGEFIGSTWDSFVRTRQGKSHPKEWNLPDNHTLNRDDRFNPYVMLYATAWLMSDTKNKFNLSEKPIHEQGIIYYLAHHEGPGGVKPYMDFLAEIQKDGTASGQTVRTQADVLEQYYKDPAKYNRILGDGARSRVLKYGIEDWLTVYFKFAVRIGSRAAASDQNLVTEIQEKRKALGLYSEESFPSGNKRIAVRVEKRNLGEQEIYDEYFTKKENGEERLQAILKVKGGQDTWIFGSSIAVGTDRFRSGNGAKTGVFGIGGFNSINFFQTLKEKWPTLNTLEKPKKIVILGLVHNEQGRNVQEIMDRHIKIVEFLRSQGIENVKIATAHEYADQNGSTLTDFNTLLRSDKYKKYCLETGVNTTAALHLNSAENRKLLPALEASNS